jgi:transcriptional regulator with XRE-family HTH domain
MTTSPTVKQMGSRDVAKALGKHLRWLREAYEEVQPGQHQQGQWSALLGITQSQLSRWESGALLPRIDQLMRIVFSTRCTFDYLALGVVSEQMPEDIQEVLWRRHGRELWEPQRWRNMLEQFQLGGPLAHAMAQRGGAGGPAARPKQRRRKISDNRAA